MQTIIEDYSKNKLPAEININIDTLKLLKERQKNRNIYVKCDFIDFILTMINKQ